MVKMNPKSPGEVSKDGFSRTQVLQDCAWSPLHRVANERKHEGRTERCGGVRQHTGARHAIGGNPRDWRVVREKLRDGGISPTHCRCTSGDIIKAANSAHTGDVRAEVGEGSASCAREGSG